MTGAECRFVFEYFCGQLLLTDWPRNVVTMKKLDGIKWGWVLEDRHPC